ncbi:hypothetical protein BSIN_4470 [Burkholderia singularis]|uniref:Uncharacterized protein n=1 Tax=Burkholderia singularis TaxID=1503053 RepID=A0A238H8I4_9BURK|nr:hypothetical protein BSIN_4470 [Burkholderia singularis]
MSGASSTANGIRTAGEPRSRTDSLNRAHFNRRQAIDL